MDSMCIKNKVVSHSISGDNYMRCTHTCVCDKNICDLHICGVLQTKLILDKNNKCRGCEQSHAAKKLNTKITMDNYNNYNPFLSKLSLHKQTIKIYHQNIISLKYKMNKLLCHLNHGPPHILCITVHHLHHYLLRIMSQDLATAEN